MHQPYEEQVDPQARLRAKVRVKAYPVKALGGLLWAYLGPLPAPELPDWEIFSWPNGFAQIVFAEIPCNWLQCQENSIDPVHFEWMHSNWSVRLNGSTGPYAPTHLKVDFEEFEYGIKYKRIRTDTDDKHPLWTVGRVCLYPNGFFLGEHFEWRVPVDDENTLSITWAFERVPKESEPYVQGEIPSWVAPIKDERTGRWITSHVINQDIVAWVGQGRIADRTQENLGASDRGVAILRRRFFDDLDAIDAGPRSLGPGARSGKESRDRTARADARALHRRAHACGVHRASATRPACARFHISCRPARGSAAGVSRCDGIRASGADMSETAKVTSLTERADALEEAMIRELNRLVIVKSTLFTSGERDPRRPLARAPLADHQGFLMGDDPRLPKMPDEPTLIDFFKYRLPARRNHLMQSAKHALKRRSAARRSCSRACCTTSPWPGSSAPITAIGARS